MGQNLLTADPAALIADLKTAKEALNKSLANLDIMVQLLEKLEDLF